MRKHGDFELWESKTKNILRNNVKHYSQSGFPLLNQDGHGKDQLGAGYGVLAKYFYPVAPGTIQLNPICDSFSGFLKTSKIAMLCIFAKTRKIDLEGYVQ